MKSMFAVIFNCLFLFPLPAFSQSDSDFDSELLEGEFKRVNAPYEMASCQTLVNFHVDPDEAFEVAAETKRPIFMVHLSGNLKNEQFT